MAAARLSPPPAEPSRALRRWLDRVERSGTFTALSVRIAHGGRCLVEHVFGCSGEAEGRARFDLASLTKPHVATLALELDRVGRLPLGTPVGEVRQGVATGLAGRTLEELLRHRGGLRPWVPLYALCRAPEEVLERLLGGEWLGARRGTYSDLGYILWGLLAEEALGEPLETLVRRWVLVPRSSGARFRPGGQSSVERCTIDGAREVELAAKLGMEIEAAPAPAPGVVQDGNARWLGGVAGHAGLFGTAEDLHRLALGWLEPDEMGAAAVASALGGSGPFALGWARRRVRGSAGRALDRRSFGHTGFTGGSLWWEAAGPRRGAVYVLLGHRRSPQSDLGALRRAFHRRAAALVDEELASAGGSRDGGHPC